MVAGAERGLQHEGGMRHSLGIPGMTGVLVLLAWLVLWLVVGELGWLHLLFPIGVALLLIQLVVRVSPESAR